MSTSSSVDEFFRSLMDIVPPGTRDKLIVNKEAKVVHIIFVFGSIFVYKFILISREKRYNVLA